MIRIASLEASFHIVLEDESDHGQGRKGDDVLVCQTAITKCHRLGSLNNRNFFSHSAEGLQSEIKVVSRTVAFKAHLHGS